MNDSAYDDEDIEDDYYHNNSEYSSQDGEYEINTTTLNNIVDNL